MKATHKLETKAGNQFDVYYSDLTKEWHRGLGMTIPPACIHSLTPLPSPREPETFDWREAMRRYLDGVEIERFDDIWEVMDNDHCFYEESRYRVKPTAPPEPKVTERYAYIYRTGVGRFCDDITSLEKSKEYDPIARLKITVTEGNQLPVVTVLPV